VPGRTVTLDVRPRIIEAALRWADRGGQRTFTLSEVAAELGAIRQTVYRHFATAEDLFDVAGAHAIESYIDELTEHTAALTTPGEWVVEMLASAIERLPSRPFLAQLLADRKTDQFIREMTSHKGAAISREMFNRSSIDWTAAGYDNRDVDELIELMLRILQSMMLDPNDPPRKGPELRRKLSGWIGPR